MAGLTEGVVSQYVNRRFSRPIARALTPTPVTPNQVSFAAFVFAVGALALFVTGYNILAGLAAQASSIIDGVDGDLARAKNMATRFGGFFDALLDRYADVAMLGGMAYWSIQNETAFSKDAVLLVALVAIVGSLMISYSRARAEATFGSPFEGPAGVLASRDARILIIMIGAISGQAFYTLIFLAVITNFVVVWRTFLARSFDARQSPETGEAQGVDGHSGPNIEAAEQSP